MKIPKDVDLKSALHQIEGTIEKESATWAGRLVEKVGAEKYFTKKEFTDDQMENFNSASRMLQGKSEKKYNVLFFKMDKKKQDDYQEISEYKMEENKISNADVLMKNAMDKIDSCVEVKELIEATIAAQKK